MSSLWVHQHRATRFGALICLSLLLLATFCAPIHKHETGRDASCLFCHATTRAEWQVPEGAAKQPVDSIAFVTNKYSAPAAVEETERTVRIPRAPPTAALSL